MDEIHDVDRIERLTVDMAEMLQRLAQIEKKLDEIQASLARQHDTGR